jgi:hypothetical protein
LVALVLALCAGVDRNAVDAGGGQPVTVGPQIGQRVPPFSGVDQTGRTQSLDTALGAKGAMLVFFRSADW